MILRDPGRSVERRDTHAGGHHGCRARYLPSRSTRLPADGWILAGAGVWALLVLAVHFRHAWTLLSRAEGRWVWPEIGQTLRYTGLPHLHEAVVRAAWATGAAGACALAVLGLGILVARVFAPVAQAARTTASCRCGRPVYRRVCPISGQTQRPSALESSVQA